MQPLAIGLHRKQVGGHVIPERHRRPPGHLHLPPHPANQRPDPNRLEHQRHGPGLQTGEVQQLLDQARQPLGLLQHHLHRLPVGLFHAVQEVLQVRPQRGDGRLQLVGHIGHQVAPEPLEALQLGRHPVERLGKAPDLVAALHGDALAVVAARQPFRGRGHVADGLRHAPGHEPRQPEGDRRGDGPR